MPAWISCKTKKNAESWLNVATEVTKEILKQWDRWVNTSQNFLFLFSSILILNLQYIYQIFQTGMIIKFYPSILQQDWNKNNKNVSSKIF